MSWFQEMKNSSPSRSPPEPLTPKKNKLFALVCDHPGKLSFDLAEAHGTFELVPQETVCSEHAISPTSLVRARWTDVQTRVELTAYIRPVLGVKDVRRSVLVDYGVENKVVEGEAVVACRLSGGREVQLSRSKETRAGFISAEVF